jgi:hypothetical protein
MNGERLTAERLKRIRLVFEDAMHEGYPAADRLDVMLSFVPALLAEVDGLRAALATADAARERLRATLCSVEILIVKASAHSHSARRIEFLERAIGLIRPVVPPAESDARGGAP